MLDFTVTVHQRRCAVLAFVIQLWILVYDRRLFLIFKGDPTLNYCGEGATCVNTPDNHWYVCVCDPATYKQVDVYTCSGSLFY